VSYSNNKNVGAATVAITGKGSFSGTINISFQIVPTKMSIPKAAAGNKQLKVTWKRVSAEQKVTKCQVRYREVGKTAWKTKTYASSKSSATIDKLKTGKRYQVQVRCYKTVSKAKYYSDWSSARTSRKVK